MFSTGSRVSPGGAGTLQTIEYFVADCFRLLSEFYLFLFHHSPRGKMEVEITGQLEVTKKIFILL